MCINQHVQWQAQSLRFDISVKFVLKSGKNRSTATPPPPHFKGKVVPCFQSSPSIDEQIHRKEQAKTTCVGLFSSTGAKRAGRSDNTYRLVSSGVTRLFSPLTFSLESACTPVCRVRFCASTPPRCMFVKITAQPSSVPHTGTCVSCNGYGMWMSMHLMVTDGRSISLSRM